MATNYTINILKLKGGTVDGQDDVVTEVNYELTGEDDGTTYSVTANINCVYDAENFTPLADLTEDQVKGWIIGDTDNHATYKNYVDDKIAKLKESKTYLTIPW
tara:strand:- start:3079 stop:3387 length:309 start_codon:yes stop_codon:yes gene_type:complete